MNNEVLCEIYGLLKSIGAVQNESEFCKDWLKRNDSYMRQLRFNQAVASTTCLAICASKLQHYGEQMCGSTVHTELGKQF